MITPAEFDKWFNGLGMVDRMNFTTLIGLPQARKLVEKMSDGQYKAMATHLLDQSAALIKRLLEI